MDGRNIWFSSKGGFMLLFSKRQYLIIEDLRKNSALQMRVNSCNKQ